MPKRSSVYDFFIQLANQNHKCKQCAKVVRACHSTSNLLSHLRKCHGRQVVSGDGRPRLLRTPTVSQQDFTDALVYFVTKDNKSLRIVESEGFRHLVTALAPTLKLPSRTALAANLEKKYALLAPRIQIEIGAAEYVSIATDSWTESVKCRSYFGLTAHILRGTMHTKVTLAANLVPEYHNAEYLKDEINSILETWNIPREKVVSITTDNAKNICEAVSLLFGQDTRIPCFAHSLNFVIHNTYRSCEELKEIAVKVKSIVGYFKQSETATRELLQSQEADGKTPLKLVEDIPTRWHSIYDMLERFVELHGYVVQTLLRLNSIHEIPDNSEVAILSETVALLEPYKLLTEELCSESHTTLGKIIPSLNCLLHIIKAKVVKYAVNAKLREELLSRVGELAKAYEMNGLIVVATLLDPRFKKLHFSDSVHLSNALSSLGEEVSASTEPCEPVESFNSSLTIWDYHDAITSAGGSYTSSIGGTEVQRYLEEPVVQRTTCPIQFWLRNKSIYPALAKVAMKYLTCVATSVPSERLFSKKGAVFESERSHLSSKLLGKSIFLGERNFEDFKSTTA